MFSDIGERLKKLAVICLIVCIFIGVIVGIVLLLKIEIVYRRGEEVADHPYIGQGLAWMAGGALGGYIIFLLLSAYAELVDKTIAQESHTRELCRLLERRLNDREQ